MLNKSIIEDILYEALYNGGDFAEIFIEDNISTELTTISGNVDKCVSGREFGIGIRVFKGLKFVYGYTNEKSKECLIELTRKITKVLDKNNSNNAIFNFDKKVMPIKHPVKLYPSNMKLADKVELAKRAFDSGMNYDNSISQVIVNYLDKEQNVLIANTENVFVTDARTRTRMYIIVASEYSGKIETGYIGLGALKGMELYEELNIEELTRETANSAKIMAMADYAPAGVMPVVLDNGFSGLMFHEACGHSLEASSVAKNTSEFSNKLKEKIASNLVTLIDDGTIVNSWGSLGIDDEGMRTQKNVLIKNGVLSNYMIDKSNSRRMGLEPTGSGRRQSYRFPPTSRMTNTYIDNGNNTREEIISNTEKGIFVKNLNAGSVNPATGDFNFSASESYLIENGKITRPVKCATLIGNGSKILKDVDMVGNNLEIGSGYCFAESGAIYIGAGQPTIRVKNMIIGGRNK